MKTKNFRLIALMITLAAVLTGVNAEAQKREYRSDRNANDDGRRYRTESRERVERREYTNKDNHSKEWKHDNKAKKYQKHDKSYAYKHHDHFDRGYDYDRRHNYYYRHPSYGVVYKKFRNTPIRLRHNHGDYYYYGGHYYRNIHGIGYVRVELPSHVVFETLPFHCDLYRSRGHVYYRYGDIYFERCAHGYRIAPSVGFQISAHF